jgi:hypothetical protein
MLTVELDRESGIAVMRPEGALSEEDFKIAARVIDPYIEEHGHLNGLIINTRQFPGWESFAALLTHLKFVREHHEKLSHVALVTDSQIADLAETLASHFVKAKVKHFAYSQFVDAQAWILDDGAG